MGAKLQAKTEMPGVDRPASDLALGTAFYRVQDRELCFRILDDFRSYGGTLIDSGRLYGDSEAVIGEWMDARAARDEMVTITKCGHGPDGFLPAEDFEDVVTEELATSLECLRTDCIDVYMLHRDNPSVPVARIMDRLNREVDRGRVRALGASNWAYPRIDMANEYADRHGLKGFVSVSNNISLAVPTGPFYTGLVSTDGAGERWHERTGTPLIAWSAQARGFFVGGYTTEMRERAASIGEGFTRRMIDIYCTDENLERLERARALGEQKGGVSATQIALAWLLHKPFPLLPIVGPHTPEELTSCVEATSIQLSEDEIGWLNLEC